MRHYACLALDEIASLPVKDVAAKDAWLFLWVTGPFLPHAFAVIKAWGFRYSGLGFTWAKLKRSWQPGFLGFTESDLHVGLGLTTRHNAELCLIGRRGAPGRLAKDVREIILAPVAEHSRKPAEAYRRIERFCAGPRLELFARERRDGWAAWGDETARFGTPIPLQGAAVSKGADEVQP
jgi:N6-adenosine-specific RNA methylase IME4